MIYIAALSPEHARASMKVLESLGYNIPYKYLSKVSQIEHLDIATIVILPSFFRRKSPRLHDALTRVSRNNKLTFIPGAEYAAIQFQYSRETYPATVSYLRTESKHASTS